MTDDETKLHQVVAWILEGASEHAIREAIFATWPDERDTPLILAAMSKISESGQASHDDVQNWCFEAMKLLYSKQVEIGEYAGAMQAVRRLEEISERRTKQQPPPQRVAHFHIHELGPVTADNIEQHRQRLLERVDRIGHVTG